MNVSVLKRTVFYLNYRKFFIKSYRSTYATHTDRSVYIWDRSISYRSTYATHIDRSIFIYGIDLSNIGLPIPHIQIDLYVYMG